ATGASRAARGLLLLLVLALEQRAVAPVALRLQLAHRDEAQARAVDAVAQPGRRRTVLEHVAEVAVAVLATHLGARHVQLVVRAFDDVARLQRTREARPAAAAVVLVERGEQRLAGDHVDVDPGLLVVPELVAERRLGRLVLGDRVLHRGQACPQLGIARVAVRGLGVVAHGVALLGRLPRGRAKRRLVLPRAFDEGGAARAALVARVVVRVGAVVILVVLLRRIERPGVEDCGDDRAIEGPARGELLLGGFRDAPLAFVVHEDRGAVLRAPVRELSAVVGRVDLPPEDVEDGGVVDLARIEALLDGLVVPGLARGGLLVGRAVRRSAGVARHRGDHAGQVVERRFDAPEAATGQRGHLHGRGRRFARRPIPCRRARVGRTRFGGARRQED